MKNTSKNNFSKRNNNSFNKKANSRSFSKTAKFNNEKNNPQKNSDNDRKPLNNNYENNKFNRRDNKDIQGTYYSHRRNSFGKNNANFFRNDDNNFLQIPNKKTFDDWIWGKHSVYEALSSNRAINRIWCTSEVFSSEKFYILLKDQKMKGVLIEEVSWNRLSQITFGAAHQGIAIQLASSKSIPLDELIDLSKTNCANPLILALDGITDPHNLGAIIRSAEAFNCKGIVLPQRRSAGLTGTVAKVAAGALEHIPVSRVVNLNRSLEELKKKGFVIIGLSGDGQVPIAKFTDITPLVVIVGSEDKGISLLTQKKCDYLLRIPLKGKTSSLNASVAAAVCLFHLTSI